LLESYSALNLYGNFDAEESSIKKHMHTRLQKYIFEFEMQTLMSFTWNIKIKKDV
jgi:hypothetical protein